MQEREQQQYFQHHYHTYTISDVIRATTCVQRVLFRKTFEELRDRPDSFYWKYVVIENSPWKDDDINRMPISFLKKYPTDFKITYSEKGCNIIKCYHDVYCNDENGDFKRINKNIQTSSESTPIYACGGACTGIYVEFFEYLLTRYDLGKGLGKIIQPIQPIHQPLVYFDTLNIIDKNETANEPFINVEESPSHPSSSLLSSPSCYCGLELTALKTLALRPSSRWMPKDNDAADVESIPKIDKEYLEEHVRHYPAKWRAATGLVDSPPLSWNAENQNVYFNEEYCNRFRSRYDRQTDTCYQTTDRKILNFFLGKHVVSQLSSNQWKSVLSFNPDFQMKIIEDVIQQKKLFTIDMGHSVEIVETPTTAFESVPIPQTPAMHPLRVNLLKTTYKFDRVIKHSVEDKNILTLFTDLAVTTIAMESSTKIPALVAYLLRYFSEHILRDMIQDVAYISTEKLYTRLLIMVIQSGLVKFGIDIAVKFLAGVSTTGGVIALISLAFLPLEILASVYNWGGYNNEMHRSFIDKERRELQTLLMKDYAHMSHVDFLSITTEGGGDFVTPNITPEIIYYVALSAFIQRFPNLEEELRKKALQDSYLMTEEEYLSQLTHNSLGQKINVVIVTGEVTEEQKDQGKKEVTDTFRKAKEYIIRQALSYTMRDTIQFSIILFSLILGIVLLMLGLIIDVNTYQKIGSFILMMSCAGMTHWSMSSEYLREI